MDGENQDNAVENVAENVSEVERTFQGFSCLNCGLVDPVKKRMIDHLVSVHIFARELAITFCNQAVKNLEERQKREKVRISLMKNGLLVRKIEMKESHQARIMCDECGKTFISTDVLQIHMKTDHFQLKPFACTLADCDMKFALKHTLSRHLETHTPQPSTLDQLETCLICQKTFASKAEVSLHMKRHLIIASKTRPFKCDECISSFQTVFGLNEHKKGHQGAHPYSCDVCDKSFKKGFNLKRHKETHNLQQRGKTAACSICHKKYSSINIFASHLVAAHKFTPDKAKRRAGTVFSRKVGTALTQLKITIKPNNSK